jgi:DNA-binding NarL/FixJ family response regulator
LAQTRLLVADNHELFRRGVRSVVESEPDWELVGEVGNGKDAVEEVRKLQPDIAILELSLPDLNGLEVAREIGRISPNTKVLVITNHYSDPLIRVALRAGARGYLSKSDSVLDFTKAIRELLLGKIFLSPKVSEVILNNYLNKNLNTPPEPKERRLTKKKRQDRKRPRHRDKFIHELPGGAIEVLNPAEVLRNETGTFEVISPYGHIFQVTCRQGDEMKVQEIKGKTHITAANMNWRIRRITPKMIN